MPATRKFTCYDCNHTFEVPYGTGGAGVDMQCPECGSANVHRAAGDRGFERTGAGSGGTGGTGGGAAGRGRGPGAEGRGRGGSGRGPRWA